MRRRQFIAGLGGAVAWPVVARAQQAALPVVGYLSRQSADDEYKNFTVPFLQGLKESGYVEGQNVAIEYRWAENQADRLPALAADLVRRRVAVIVASSTPAALAAKKATTIIPIVFATGGDPVALGLVASLNRPGGNLTGTANLAGELAPKRLQLLRQLLPNAVLFGVLADPAFPVTQSTIADLQAAARTLGLQLLVVNASTDRDLEAALATFSQQHVGAVLVSDSPFFNRRMEQLATLTARHALPALFAYWEYALAGGLMSYGTSLGYVFHQSGIYAGRILKGDKPADLPVQQVTKIELVINLKTAKALGLTIPGACIRLMFQAMVTRLHSPRSRACMCGTVIADFAFCKLSEPPTRQVNPKASYTEYHTEPADRNASARSLNRPEKMRHVVHYSGKEGCWSVYFFDYHTMFLPSSLVG